MSQRGSVRSASTSANPGERGFTLIELLVVIAIIGILIAMLEASVHKSRGRANAIQATDALDQVAAADAVFQDEFGRGAASLPELIDFCRRFPSLCDLYEIMPNGQTGGYAFSARPGGGWVAEPVAPGLTGSDTILCDGSVRPAPRGARQVSCDGSVIPTPGAQAAQALASRRILGHGARLIGSLLAGRPEAVTAIREGQLPGLRDVERELDQDGDGSVRIGELFAWSVDEDPRVAEFLGQVAAELQLGAGGEDAVSLLLPAVQAGAEPPVFDYATLRTLTRDAVHDWRAEAWLVFWVRYAEWAVSRGDVDAESFAVGRYLRRLEPELLRSVTITDGTSLEQILLATATEAPQPPRRPGRR